jgi:phage/plasmid-associated DNA primase
MTRPNRKAVNSTTTAGINTAAIKDYDKKVDDIRRALEADSGYVRTAEEIEENAREDARDRFYARYGLNVYLKCGDFATKFDSKNGQYEVRSNWRYGQLMRILRNDFRLCLIDDEPALLSDPVTTAMCDGYYRRGREAITSVVGRVLNAGVCAYNREHGAHPHSITPRAIRDAVDYVYDHAGDDAMVDGRTFRRQLGVFATKDNRTIRVTELNTYDDDEKAIISYGSVSTDPVTYADHVLYTGKLPVSYDLPDAARLSEARAFVDKWLLSLADGDEARRDRMVEMVLSAPMMPSTSIPGAAVLYGNGNEGKSTLVAISQAMFGASHSFAGSFTNIFGTRFGKSPASKGAHFVRIDEMPSNTIDPEAVADLKTVSSGQETTTDIKGGTTNAVVPLLYVIMTTNHPIKFPTGDASLETLERRFHLVHFKHYLKPDEVDKTFVPSFIADEYKMCALFRIALEGVERLLAQGKPTPVVDDDSIMRNWITGSDTVGLWLDEVDIFGRDLDSEHFNLISRRGSRNYTCVAPASWFTGKVYLMAGTDKWTTLPDFDLLMNGDRRNKPDFYLESEARLVSANDINGQVIQHGFSNETIIAYERYIIWREANGHRRHIAMNTFVTEMVRHGYKIIRPRSPLSGNGGKRTHRPQIFVPDDANISNVKDYRTYLENLSAYDTDDDTDKTDTTDKSTDFRTWLSENKTARALLDYKKGDGTAFASDDAARAAAFDLFCALCDRFDLGM